MAADPRPPGVNAEYLLGAVKKLRFSRDYSDLTIKCGTRQWPVHKAIVCTQSNFFANACKEGWRESASGIIDLVDEREEVVDAVVDFFYLSSYDYSKSVATKTSVIGPLQFSVKLFAAADKFLIDGLEYLALHNFNILVEQVSLMARPDFLGAIYEVYETTPSRNKTMREQMVSKTISQAVSLFDKTSENLPSSPQFQRLIRNLPSFGAEVVLALTARMEEKMAEMESLKKGFAGSETSHCPHCDVDFKVAKELKDETLYCPRCKKVAIRFWAWS